MDIPKYYEPKEAEPRWQKTWEERGLYRFAGMDDGRPLYSIDTPPPTVSGKLHIGHVFSYTQTEVIARYKRLKGFNVFYPFGFDDNGLPTELLTEREHGVRGDQMERAEFTKLCLATSAKYSGLFKDLWQALGFSCDWDSIYSTINDVSRRVSQRSFLDLHGKGYVYCKEMPTLWCTKCKTAFAQAEIEDIQKGSKFQYIHFHTAEGEKLPVATTRPELLGSCVAVFIHPEHPTMATMIGKKAIVPLFGHEVPIIADVKADPSKGTGVVMCCTFGDTTDIEWWRQHDLPLRISFTDDGHMTELAGEFAGLSIKEAHVAISEKLQSEGITFKTEELAAENRAVNTHERCGTEVEFLVKKQWFVNVMDHKEKLVAQGEKVNWYPRYMGIRYKHWVENLCWDWCVSRQRFFGIPIPAWHCVDCGALKMATPEQLPVDPLVSRPTTACACGSENFEPERDVLDTWATSSVTPQINYKWGEGDEMTDMFPMSMRPQAHDIIRTWAFYTITKSAFHFDSVPWQDAVISGHVTKKGLEEPVEDRGTVAGKGYTRKSKISKSKDGDRFSPAAILEANPADAIRYWACSGKLGTDLVFNEQEIADSTKLLTKLWNASKFAMSFIEGYERPDEVPELENIDRWLLGKLNATTRSYHASYEDYEFLPARNELHSFFWHAFCDNYIELVKGRLYDEARDEKAKASGRWTLSYALEAILKLFAPYLPHITEEIWQFHFAAATGVESIHATVFSDEVAGAGDEACAAAGDALVGLISLARGEKTRRGLSLAVPIRCLHVACDAKQAESLRLVEAEIKDVCKAEAVSYVTSGGEERSWSEESFEDMKLFMDFDPDVLYAAEVAKEARKEARKWRKAEKLGARDALAKVIVTCAADRAAVLRKEAERILGAVGASELEVVEGEGEASFTFVA